MIEPLILTLYKELEKRGVNLKRICIGSNQKFRDSAKKEGLELYLLETGDLLYSKDGVEILFHEEPWRVNYVHPEDMDEEYFLKWRHSFKLIKELGENLIGAEIGVFEGFLTDKVLNFVKPAKYYLIDPWVEYNDDIGDLGHFNQNTWDEIYQFVCNKYKNNKAVEVIRKSSLDAAKDIPDGSLDFVYIDADHRTDAVYNDIKAWCPKVRMGGFIAGHDFRQKTVMSGIFKFIGEGCLDEENKLTDGALGKRQVYSKGEDWWFRKEE